MNKKLLVMVMVPVLVVMSGALAFSAFSGTITTNVNASAGYISWNQSLKSYYIYENNTVVGTNAAPGYNTTYMNHNMTSMTVDVTNLAPGNWMVLNFTVKNTGSVGLEFSLGTNSTMISYSNGTTGYNESVSTSVFKYGEALSNGFNGYEYAIVGPQTGSIDVGHSVTYSVYIGLDNAKGFGSLEQNFLEESSFTLGVHINVMSDP